MTKKIVRPGGQPRQTSQPSRTYPPIPPPGQARDAYVVGLYVDWPSKWPLGHPRALAMQMLASRVLGVPVLAEKVAAPRRRPDARELLAFTNGILHLPTGVLFPPTPAFFTTRGLPFPYNEADAPPDHWLRFLHSLLLEAVDRDFGGPR